MKNSIKFQIHMKIKTIIFDLDGVLIDSKKIHYDSLNQSLRDIDESYVISWEEHLSKYDALKTNQKLDILTKEKNLPIELHEKIWKRKQELTSEKLKFLEPTKELKETIHKLSEEKYKIICCSNSIRSTVFEILSKLDILRYFDLVLSNDDVLNGKPSPEIYWTAMIKTSSLPEETLILEDSPVGLLSAKRSNANILRISEVSETNYTNIKNKIIELENNLCGKIPKWKDNKLNILVPMAGAGSRFELAGYSFPKPLIEVKGKPMIQVVIENLNIDANYIFVVQKKHIEHYNIDSMLKLISPNCKIIVVDGITDGAARTALMAKEFIDNDNPLIFANSDQLIEWDSNEFMYKMNESDCDGGILTFTSNHPKWSFVKIDNYGFVTEVAEKNPISNIATVGVYYWKKGSDFVKYAEQMINRDKKVNGEFYVCPVFNESIEDNKKIKTYEVKKMWGLGTPEDLKYYLENNNK